MNQVISSTTEGHVFNRQQSISTTSASNNETFIVVSLLPASATTHLNFDFLESKIENSADLWKKFYDLPIECENYIRSLPNNVKIFIMVSNEYAQTLLQNIHNLQTLHSVYIYSQIRNKEEFTAYPKMINVYTDLQILTDQLCSTVYNYIRYAQLPMTIFKQQYEHDQSVNTLNKFAYFVDFWNPLFLDFLVDLPSTDYDQQRITFIKQCRICYRGNEATLKAIDEFETTYKPEFAIQWYKRDSFVYRLLNKVMRQQNIPGILTLRFFIMDLSKQLYEVYNHYIETEIYEDNSSFTVYRGLLIDHNELNNLQMKLTCGTILSVNTVLSTSRTLQVALEFAGAIDTEGTLRNMSPNMKSVLFQIEMKIDQKYGMKRKPFADISYVRDNDQLKKKDEYEVLCMAGSFLRVDEVHEGKEIELVIEEKIIKTTVTLFKLTWINEDDLSIPIMKDYQILKSTRTFEGKLIRIGNLLIDHSLSISSSRSKADTYYKALHNEQKSVLTAACLTGQAWVALKRKQYDLAIQLALQALSIGNQSNDEWKITTLNCLGGVYSEQKNYPAALRYYRQAYDLSKPTDEKIANKSYLGPCIPVDKYAMYDNYRNISSINMACIHQKKGDIQLAWTMYKEAVDCDMRDTIDFHCHTCMTIAESDTHESELSPIEHSRAWQNWKSFLDLGIVDIIKFRTPAVTGYLSLSHQYDFPSRRYNNRYCRTMAIDYFQKVEKQCAPYVSDRQYYLYTLQCYERLAVLFGHANSRSLDYYEKMICLCLKYHPNDLENLIVGYQGLMNTYKLQQSEGPASSDTISILLCAETTDLGVSSNSIPMTPPVSLITPPLTPLTSIAFGTLFQNIKPLDFAFGFYDKRIDPRMQNELDSREKMIYCRMKLAALYYNAEKLTNAKDSLRETILLCQQLGSKLIDIRRICKENLSFIDQNYDFIIHSYQNRLSIISDIHGQCADEDYYCYIAYLYEKKTDFKSTLEFLRKPIENFEHYNYICIHTIDCYTKLAEHYQMIQNTQLAIRTYERAINLVKKHLPDSMVTLITIIEEHFISYLKKTNDLEITIVIYKTLCDIVQRPTTDIMVLYTHFKRVLKLLVKKHDALNAVLNAYDTFLSFALKIISPLTSQLTMVLGHFRDHGINAYKHSHQLLSAIEIYQKLLNLLFHYQNDTRKIEDEYKTIAAGFLSKHLLNDSVITHENLLYFACKHPLVGYFIEDDLISFVFMFWKQRIIDQYLMANNFRAAISLHDKMICFLKRYRSMINPEYDLDEFIATILQNYEEISRIYLWKEKNCDQAIHIYQQMVEFLTEYKVGSVHIRIKTIMSTCQQFANEHLEQAIEMYSKLVNFLQNNRLHYLPDLFIVQKEFAQLQCAGDKQYAWLSPDGEITTACYSLNSQRLLDLHQRLCDYKQKAKNYFNNNQYNQAITVYRNELLPFLLENHARDDEQIATCYRDMALLYSEKNIHEALNYYKKAIDIYETQKDDFYTDDAFRFNPNVCRRYAGTLFMCYNRMREIAIDLNDQVLADFYQQKVDSIYREYQDQFQFVVHPVTNVTTIQIRPFVELAY